MHIPFCQPEHSDKVIAVEMRDCALLYLTDLLYLVQVLSLLTLDFRCQFLSCFCMYQRFVCVTEMSKSLSFLGIRIEIGYQIWNYHFFQLKRTLVFCHK